MSSANGIQHIGRALGVDPFHLMGLAGIPLPEDRSKRDPAIEHIAQRLEKLSPQIKGPIITSIGAQIDAVETIDRIKKMSNANTYSMLDTPEAGEVIVEPIYENDPPDVVKYKAFLGLNHLKGIYPDLHETLREKLGEPPEMDLEFA